MNQTITLTIIEFIASVIVEGVILSGIFAYVSNKASTTQQQNLKMEMNNIETQNKFIYEQTANQIERTKTEIISQIKESSKNQ